MNKEKCIHATVTMLSGEAIIRCIDCKKKLSKEEIINIFNKNMSEKYKLKAQ